LRVLVILGKQNKGTCRRAAPGTNQPREAHKTTTPQQTCPTQAIRATMPMGYGFTERQITQPHHEPSARLHSIVKEALNKCPCIWVPRPKNHDCPFLERQFPKSMRFQPKNGAFQG
jgi:hypothetical protein